MDGWFMNDGSFAFKNEGNKAAYDQELRKAAKDIIYMYLNAVVRNQAYAEETGDRSVLKPAIRVPFPLWEAGLAAADILVLGIFLVAERNYKGRKKKLYDVVVKNINCVCARTNKQFILIDTPNTENEIKWCEHAILWEFEVFEDCGNCIAMEQSGYISEWQIYF